MAKNIMVSHVSHFRKGAGMGMDINIHPIFIMQFKNMAGIILIMRLLNPGYQKKKHNKWKWNI